MPQYRLKHSLGLTDAKTLNDNYDCSLPIKAEDLTAGSIIEITNKGYSYLREGKGYVALLEQVSAIKGEAKRPEVAQSK